MAKGKGKLAFTYSVSGIDGVHTLVQVDDVESLEVANKRLPKAIVKQLGWDPDTDQVQVHHVLQGHIEEIRIRADALDSIL